jgi:hypothetical protein
MSGCFRILLALLLDGEDHGPEVLAERRGVVNE